MAVSRKRKKKLAPGRRKATPAQLADLKAAKKRGLHSLDLRQPLTSYGRSLAAKFAGMSEGKWAVVKVDSKKDRSYYKNQGLDVVGDKVLVYKSNRKDSVRYNPKTGRIKKLVGVPGERTEVDVVFDIKQLPRLGKSQRYEVTFQNRHGISTRRFASKSSLAQFMEQYPKPGQGTSRYFNYSTTIITV